MKVAIVGSRGLADIDISKYVSPDVTEIITGGAKGVDSLAEKYADENGIIKTVIKPNYRRYKRGAPLKRNKEIVQMSDKIIALWDGKSRGTKFTIEYAKK